MTNPIVLQLAPGNAISGSEFVFRVSYASSEELVRDLRVGGFGAEIPISHSSELQRVDILVTLLRAGGGLAGLSALLAVFLARHEKKSVVLEDGTSVTGYSAEDVRKILATIYSPDQDPQALPEAN